MPRTSRTRALNVPTGPVTVNLPQFWTPRSYQRPLVMAMPANIGTDHLTKDRFVLPWHRRSGKDLTCLALTTREMRYRMGYYVHIFPDLKQGRPIIWDGKDGSGIPFLDRFPSALIHSKNETELQLTLKPFPGQPGYGDPNAAGSIFQLRGANEPDTLRGPNYVGVVFSEFSEMDPYVWTAIIQPVLEENKGWAIFNFTPKGRNHAYKMYLHAQNDPRFFCQLLTINDTKRDAPGENGQAVVSEAQIEQMRKEGTPEDQIQQEYYVSFTGFLHGTIFGDMIVQARKDNRITRVPYNSALPVGCWMDIGRTDSTAIWFYQRQGQRFSFIDYYENAGPGADHYAKIMREKPYLISRVVMPHDARVTGFTATESPEQYFRRIFRGVTIAPKLAVQTGIDMTRRLFSRFEFDGEKCSQGIEHLENYRRKWDEEKHDYSGEPIHDQHSHGSDALRTGVQGVGDSPLEFDDERSRNNPHQQDTDYSIFGPNPVLQ